MIGPALRWALYLASALALAGCGLKGSLTLPSQSEEVVIREAGQTAPAPPSEPAAILEAGTPPAAAAIPAAEPTAVPAEKKPARRDNRLPPPPLPGGNPGTARGG